jgi:PleD family two-component response regulator
VKNGIRFLATIFRAALKFTIKSQSFLKRIEHRLSLHLVFHTVFSVYLQTSQSFTVEFPARKRLRVARIFIVDDHQSVRMQLRHLLESFNEWEVCAEAANGREAVQKHGTVQPHVTVMDFQLPEFNGVEASRLPSFHGGAR